MCIDSLLESKPKRLVSLWKNITDSSVQVFLNGHIENFNAEDSAVWRIIDGKLTIAEIAQITGIGLKNIIKTITSWKKKQYALLNYTPLSSSKEATDLLLFDTSNIKSNPDVLFIVPPSPHASTNSSSTSSLYPLGIGYLCSIIEKESNYSFDALNLWNENINESTVEAIVAHSHPKALGLSVMTDNYENGIIISRIAKNIYPELTIFMGGPHATFRAEEILSTEETVDYILLGESENTIIPFLDSVFSGEMLYEKLLGVGFRTCKGISVNPRATLIKDLDALPYPKRGKTFFEKTDEVGIITSRGCPGRCIFCCANKMSGNRYRMRSPHNVVQEIAYLYDHGARKFTIVDDTFTVNIPRMYKILSLIQDLGLEGVSFSAESRVDVVDYDINIFSQLYETGFSTVQFGVESGSQLILDKLKKRITIEQIFTAVRLAAQAHLIPNCTMLIGHPFETSDTIQESIEFAKKLVDLGAYVFFSVVTPYPGSEIGDFASRYGITIEKKSFAQYSNDNPIIRLPNMSSQSIREAFYDATLIIAKYSIKKRYN